MASPTAYYRLVLTPHANLDVRGTALVASAPTLGIHGLRGARVSELYFLRGPLDNGQLARLCETALVDPAAYDLHVSGANGNKPPTAIHSVEVAYLPGVMDPLALQLARAAVQIGLPLIEVATGICYELDGDLSTGELLRLTERLLYNATVQRYALGTIEPIFRTGERSKPHVDSIPLAGLDDKALASL